MALICSELYEEHQKPFWCSSEKKVKLLFRIISLLVNLVGVHRISLTSLAFMVPVYGIHFHREQMYYSLSYSAVRGCLSHVYCARLLILTMPHERDHALLPWGLCPLSVILSSPGNAQDPQRDWG